MRQLLCIAISLLVLSGLKSQDEVEINVLWDLVEKYDTLQAYGWGLDSNYCSSWQGIRCDENNHITALDLSHKGLTDTLPSSICHLSNLTFLDIHNCGLTYLPPCMVDLTLLKHFSIRLNLFKEVPDIVWDFSSLQFLDISKLCLTEVPKEIERLTQLKTLNIGDNHFSAFDPIIYTLDSLDRLVMNNCGLRALPDDINMLKSLTSFSLRDNLLESLPESIGDISDLSVLELSSNKISSLPETIKNLDKLRTLSINDNLLEALPDAFGDMETLYSVSAKNNKVQTIQESILSAPNLYSLFLQNNEIKQIPVSMDKMERLRFLSLQDNRLDFDDIIPYTAAPRLLFNYEPQDSILNDEVLCININESLRMEATLANPDVKYQWYKNDESIVDANEGYYEIDQMTDDDEGKYHCVLTHDSIPSLTLIRRPVQVIPNSPLYVNKIITKNPSCPGGSDGSIELGEICGAAPFNYTWNAEDWNNLVAGTYTFIIEDFLLNQLTLEITLEDGVPISPNVTTAKSEFNPTLGAIHVNPSGGTPPYEVFLDGEIACHNTLENISPGEYTLEIIDANQCNVITTVDMPLYTSTNNPSLQEQVDIYPTITSDNISIYMDNYHNAQMSIYSMNGIKHAQHTLTNNVTSIDIFSLDAGMYLVHISKKGASPAIRKILKF